MLSLSAAALISSGMIASSNSEKVLRDSFATALNTTPTVRATNTTVASSEKGAPIAGSEEYWLTHVRPDAALPLTRTISIGDRIALAYGGNRRQLVVSKVSEYRPPVTEIDTRSNQTHLLLITAHDAGNRSGQPVRFLMEVATSADAKPTAPRAL